MLRVSIAALAAAGFSIALPLAASATTCNSVAACVLGNNTGSGVGLEGVAQTNVGLYGVSTSNHGIDGRSRQSYGVVGYTYANGTTTGGARAGVYGIDTGTGIYNSGVFGASAKGYAVLGRGAVGVAGAGNEIGGLFVNNDSQAPSLGIANESSGGPVFEAESATAVLASIDGAGNETLAGNLTQRGTPQFRTRTTGNDITSYGARTSSPTLEDFGTAQLRNGAASVTLEATFASAIDARSYMVFITPHGNSNGLYTESTTRGFTVRENNGGRASLAFDYRIVAKPLDAKAVRLPAMAPAAAVARKRLPAVVAPTRER